MSAVQVLGIDVGTSGARISALDAGGNAVAQVQRSFAGMGLDRRAPAAWWAAVHACLQALAQQVPLQHVRGLGVDGTSGTLLALDAAHQPVGAASLYDDVCTDPAVHAALQQAAPPDSVVHGATSALARAVTLLARPGVVSVVHQADWIAGQLHGRPGISDEHNALKTGYDPVQRQWPDWLGEVGITRAHLPHVLEPGTPVAPVLDWVTGLGIPPAAWVHAGTTDGCASFLATGARELGDGVTALGSTLVLKLLSVRPVFSSRHGIYSHRMGELWLTGGASNTGGRVIDHLFPRAQLDALTAALQPDRPTGLDYYPLLQPGERFPINDPALPPRLVPRPATDAAFFQGVLEGMAAIEAQGYQCLHALGAPALRTVRTVGGGAANAGWQALRAHALRVPMLPALSLQASAGTAHLVLQHLSPSR